MQSPSLRFAPGFSFCLVAENAVLQRSNTFFQVNIFVTLMNSTPTESDSLSVTASGVLSTLETIVDCVEEHPDIMRQLEEVIRGLVQSVFETGMMGESIMVHG